MPRKKKSPPVGNTPALDPMSAALIAGLTPHIEAIVTDQVATLLAEMLAKIAPERLASDSTHEATSAPARTEAAPAEPPAKVEPAPSKGANGTKKGAIGPAVPSES